MQQEQQQRISRKFDIVSCDNPLTIQIPSDLQPGTNYFHLAIYEFCSIDPVTVSNSLSNYIKISSPQCNEILNAKSQPEGIVWVVPICSAIGTHVKYFKQETMEDSTDVNQLCHQINLEFKNENDEILKFNVPYHIQLRIYKC